GPAAGAVPVSPAEEQARRGLGMLEDLLAMQTGPFLCQFFIHLRNLINSLVVAPVLLLLAGHSDPFQPQRVARVFRLTLLAAAGAQTLAVFVQMERDEVLSHISGTTPNRVTFDTAFLGNVLTYVAPAAVIFLAQFGDVTNMIFGWFEPVVRALK